MIAATGISGPPARRGHAVAGEKDLAEATIQAIVCQHLALRAKPGTVWLHVPNGGLRSKGEAARMKGQVIAGAPDLLLWAGGKSFALELKAARGRLSDVQTIMHARMAAAGVEVAVAWGLNDALRQLETWGILK